MKKSVLVVSLFLVLFQSCKKIDQKNQVFNPTPVKEIVLDSLRHPWSISFLSEDEVLITEKDGDLIKANLKDKSRIKIKGFPSDLVDSIRVKDFRDNSGLFEVVQHPNFKSNQLIYISYAAENSNGTTTKIIRAKLNDDSLTNIETIFVADPYRFDLFHYGGGMVFGKDSKLYFTIGERYYNENEQPTLPIAQDLDDKRGKIHRLNDDGSIPTDNPDFGNEKISSIYATGIRAAQGIALDTLTGMLWFSEHGSVQGDELNLLQKGANYGWPIKTTGKYRNSNYEPPIMENVEFTAPQHYWLQTIAPTGLCIYRGSEFPAWQGDIILAGLSRGSLWRIKLDGTTPIHVEELFVNDRVRSRKVAQSPNGKLYMLTDEPNGKLIRIKPAAKDD
ncbi:PQQ-dependent sugar dehydrogenase [Fulvivirga sp. RKSG066]|uniref:PQQ-dependent sugar dehydrogenase n=1 Tax=Fulvivirga aurantia TaxID=2529383 RepID=UPI0012BC273D|nr:PQQ-dependent sugar dehydrogenase [Fulvivirga aurantia]MTI20929.1 PQQ-dependent sugar dehydrogenase [Fulvivirga aurantia]